MKKRAFALITALILVFVSLSACSKPYEVLLDAFSNDSDVIGAVNNISKNSISSTVTLTVENKNGYYTTIKTGGSGVIYAEDSTAYYVLTNAHVIKPENNYNLTLSSISIKDHKAKTRSAKLLKLDEKYDLAVITISKINSSELTVSRLADANPSIGEIAVAASSPGGQLNSVTVGKIKEIDSPSGGNGDNIDLSFDVICHSAWLNEGSSGSALFSSDGRIIGINYAITTSENGDHLESYAIPVEKVREFLETYDLPR